MTNNKHENSCNATTMTTQTNITTNTEPRTTTTATTTTTICLIPFVSLGVTVVASVAGTGDPRAPCPVPLCVSTPSPKPTDDEVVHLETVVGPIEPPTTTKTVAHLGHICIAEKTGLSEGNLPWSVLSYPIACGR